MICLLWGFLFCYKFCSKKPTNCPWWCKQCMQKNASMLYSPMTGWPIGLPNDISNPTSRMGVNIYLKKQKDIWNVIKTSKMHMITTQIAKNSKNKQTNNSDLCIKQPWLSEGRIPHSWLLSCHAYHLHSGFSEELKTLLTYYRYFPGNHVQFLDFWNTDLKQECIHIYTTLLRQWLKDRLRPLGYHNSWATGIFRRGC